MIFRIKTSVIMVAFQSLHNYIQLTRDQTRISNQCEEKCSVSKKSNLQIQYKEVTEYFLNQKKI